nr:hypothetical protein [Prolixibacteraceae bacterium]
VIVWDIKQYYAYLPAAIIHHDLSLEFMKEDPEFYGKWIWPAESPTGKKTIITTMGLSFLYSPFFLIAHSYSSISQKFEANGYSKPYHIALTFSALFYLLLGLFFLRKTLLRFYSEKIAALTLFLIAAGTNLLFYSTYEAPMSHCYNFALISVFFYLTILWRERRSMKNTVFLGLLGGLIALIRPTNIIVLLIIPLYGIKTFKDLKIQLASIFSEWGKLLAMIAAFITVWLPQFIYWKYVSGKYIYFSYSEIGGEFFFDNPQIFKFLFSYEKGWLVYTPVMFIALIGFIFLFKNKKLVFWPTITLTVLSIYILSSWWSWWFGGGFGQRSMVDYYGILALPLAALIEHFSTRKVFKYVIPGLLIILASFNIFQTVQYHNGAIHYWWMNKEAYWETFLKPKPTPKYWYLIRLPDYEKARQGIYVSIPAENKKTKVNEEELVTFIIDELTLSGFDTIATSICATSIENYAKELVKNHQAEEYFNRIKIKKYTSEILASQRWTNQVEKKAKKKDVAFKHMLELEAQRVYNLYGVKYD